MSFFEEYTMEMVETGLSNCRKCLAINESCLEFLSAQPRTIDEYIEWRTERKLISSERTLRRKGLDTVIEQINFARTVIQEAIVRLEK